MSATRGRARETRLLIVTLGISAVMLLLLAQLRFPNRDDSRAPAAPASAAPLERLAARATYEELASILRGVDRQIGASILPVRVADDGASADAAPIYVPAVRISADEAVALTGVGRRVLSGDRAAGTAADVLATDAPRGLVVLRTPGGAGAVPDDAPNDISLPSPGYLAAVEATRGGPAVRPLYFGRADRITDPRWPTPVIRLSALQQMLPAGAAVFTLDGHFIGAGVPDERDFLVVPAALLRAEADRVVQHGSIASADLGVDVQRLDAELRAATGAAAGVVVTYVASKGPSDGVLAEGDVITRVGPAAIASVPDYTGATMELTPGKPVTVDVQRGGSPLTLTLTPSARTAVADDAAAALGLALHDVRNEGSEVIRVAPRSAAALAGLVPGDLITAVSGDRAPDPERVTRAFHGAPAGARLLVMVDRGAAHLVLVIAKP